MNEKVRSYLIDVARQKGEQFVGYGDMLKACQLDIDLGTPEGQFALKQLLVDISTYEHANGRRMLTAIAFNKTENDQGNGFYELAEEFGYGKSKELQSKYWGFDEAKRVREFWRNDDNYRQFAKIQVSKLNTIAELFTRLINDDEYSWAADWAKNYVAFVKDVQQLKVAIQQHPNVAIDDNSLYAGLSEDVQTYENFMWKWLKEHRNGISSRGQSVLSEANFYTVIEDDTFKIIARAVILNPTLENYNLFMSWWYGNEDISNRPLLINRALAACNPEQLTSTVHFTKFWKAINILMSSYGFTYKTNPNWNWYAANVELTEWLDVELAPVISTVSDDRLEQLIWRNIFVWLVYAEFEGAETSTPNTLNRKPRPNSGYDEVPEGKRTFQGYDTDFEAKAREQKELGDAGEELVVKLEKEFLQSRGLHGLAEKVCIVKHGKGYDVASFDSSGNEKFIEVKTTTGGALAPFYLTDNEYAFMQLNKGSYLIYRIYNYDEENNCGDFFELSGDVEDQLLMRPTQYKVVLKKS